jgi:AcrR family transcriptional regulator
MATRTADTASTPKKDDPIKTTRRRRGEPRRLLLESAHDLFSRQGYSATSTREIADHAGVSETLMFRYFGSKAGLFREALVVPFVEYIEDLNTRWQSGALEGLSGEAFTRLLVGDLFDLFRANRGLVVMLWAADGFGPKELAETGVYEIENELNVLVRLGTAETVKRHGPPLARHDLATRSMLAMVAGMAVFGRAFYGKRLPSRNAIIEELTQAVLYGRLHRDDPHDRSRMTRR